MFKLIEEGHELAHKVLVSCLCELIICIHMHLSGSKTWGLHTFDGTVSLKNTASARFVQREDDGIHTFAHCRI